jgi:unsaturated rhamnogalacturonyl hydrolase
MFLLLFGNTDMNLRKTTLIAQIDDALGKLIHCLVGIQDRKGDFLFELPGGIKWDIKSWNSWDWVQGVGLYGLIKHHDRTGDESTLAELRKWFSDAFVRGEPPKNINTMAPMLALAFLTEKTGDQRYVHSLNAWAEWAMYELPRTQEGGFQHVVIDKLNNEELWDDTLVMTVLPLAKIGQLLGRPQYIEEAKRQFLLHAKYLADRETGLWFHGWKFDGRHHFARALWGRGNSWVTVAIPEFIDLLDLPPGDAHRLFLSETLHAQVNALSGLQDASGLWRTLLNDSSSYLEASATAGFAYGILKGVRKNYLHERFRPTGVRAAEAVLANINAAGELGNVSFGTPMFGTLQEYRDVPLTTMPYGQALAILALEEYRLLCIEP